jgi:hypothetical protein
MDREQQSEFITFLLINVQVFQKISREEADQDVL